MGSWFSMKVVLVFCEVVCFSIVDVVVLYSVRGSKGIIWWLIVNVLLFIKDSKGFFERNI